METTATRYVERYPSICAHKRSRSYCVPDRTTERGEFRKIEVFLESSQRNVAAILGERDYALLFVVNRTGSPAQDPVGSGEAERRGNRGIQSRRRGVD